MEWLKELARRLRMLSRRRQFDRDLDEEMQFHQELRARNYAAHGAAPEDARFRARRRFGNALALREQSRDVWGWLWLDQFLQDMKYGARTMARTPGFTAVAVITIALAVGATTAIFSIDDAVLFRSLPYSHPERLVEIFQRYYPEPNMDRMPVAPGNYFDWKTQANIFDGVAAYRLSSLNLSGNDNPERVRGAETTADTFDVLGVQPLLGRGFRAGEDSGIAAPVAVISYSLWQRRFAGDAAVIGKPLQANNSSYTIVGVMPQSFRFPIGWLAVDVDVWTPLAFKASDRNDRSSTPLDVVARLAPGISIRQGQSTLDVVARRLSAAYPQTNKNWGVNLMPLNDRGIIGYRHLFVFLSLAVGTVLLIACANVANLLLARGIGRQRELAVRAAIGAGKLRLIRQLLTEGALLSICGGILGILIASWGIHVLLRIAPTSNMPEMKNVALNGRVLIFSAAVSMIAGLLFSIMPAITNSSQSLGGTLQETARSSHTERQVRLKFALVIAEIGLTLALVACAGAVVRSFASYMSYDIGFDPDGVLLMRLALPQEKYKQPEQWSAFYASVQEELAAIPGVAAAAIGSSAPMEMINDYFRYEIPDTPEPSGGKPLGGDYSRISPDYFRAAGMKLVAGRSFRDSDSAGTNPVAIVNQTFARKAFVGRDPLAQWVLLRGDFNASVNADNHSRRVQIVGVVRDERDYSLFHDTPPILYTPMAQDPVRAVSLMVKTKIPESALLPEIRRRMLRLDPDQPVYNVRTLNQVVHESHALFRFDTLILASFAMLAALLSLVGIYGVVAYSVEQRTREFGIRMALGSTPWRVLALVLRQSATVGVAGVAIGEIAALPALRLLTSSLKNSMYIDLVGSPAPLLAAIGAAIVAVVLLATFVPARRATRIDPMVALRYE